MAHYVTPSDGQIEYMKDNKRCHWNVSFNYKDMIIGNIKQACFHYHSQSHRYSLFHHACVASSTFACQSISYYWSNYSIYLVLTMIMSWYHLSFIKSIRWDLKSIQLIPIQLIWFIIKVIINDCPHFNLFSFHFLNAISVP